MEVKGFSAAAVKAGIRYQDRLDLGLIYSDRPAVTAGVFTRNKVKAAPVLLDQQRLKQGQAQAILVNSGNANACTGAQGMEFARLTSEMAANRLKIDPAQVLVASTGVIGEPLDPQPFADAMPTLVSSLSRDGFSDLARAMMTTDTRPKISTRTIAVDGTVVSLLGVAKGAGMIMPDMATMLSFVITDAQIVFPVLRDIVRCGVANTFNRITVDGDTSTNDTVLVMANGAAGNGWLDEDNPAAVETFSQAVREIFAELATMIVEDGEGATKLVTVRVEGAREQEQALDAARTIANSPLVKTAFFGEDPNWGRIIAALGRSACTFREERVNISFDDVLMVKDGCGLGPEAEKKAAEVLRKKRFTVAIHLNDGAESGEILTCDLSDKYIAINADYRS